MTGDFNGFFVAQRKTSAPAIFKAWQRTTRNRKVPPVVLTSQGFALISLWDRESGVRSRGSQNGSAVGVEEPAGFF